MTPLTIACAGGSSGVSVVAPATARRGRVTVTRWAAGALALALSILLSACQTSAAAEGPAAEDVPAGDPARWNLFDGIKQLAGSTAQQCFVEAADEWEPPGDADGVALEDIPETALEACRDAVSHTPADAQLQHLLGRSALAVGDGALALTAFTAAAEAGWCGANFYLGASRERPWQEGQPVNLAEARTYYEAAADCGYPPAEDALAAITFDKTVFVRPDVMERLFQGSEADLTALNDQRPLNASVLQGVWASLGELWLPDAESCATSPIYKPGPINRQLDDAERGDLPTGLHRVGVDALISIISYADPVWGADSLQRTRELLREQGRIDGIRMISLFGCDSPITTQIVAGVTAFANRPRSVLDVAKQHVADPKVRSSLKEIFSTLEDHGRAFDALLK